MKKKQLTLFLPENIHTLFKAKVALESATMQDKLLQLVKNYLNSGKSDCKK